MHQTSLLIVVPTLDSHHLLPRLISSLQHQSWPHWRLVFIDGPSCNEHRSWLQKLCLSDLRFRWVEQDSEHFGIFGAMNQGFSLASSQDWVLFWGSDDWAASPEVFAEAITALDAADPNTDLLVCQARYADSETAALGRSTRFQPAGLLDNFAFRRALLLGSSPPHQATFFGPGARDKLNYYSSDYFLSSDLDYFLKYSRLTDFSVQCLDLELVHMADGGVSGQQTQRRLQEVRRAYQQAFGRSWWFPFLARYFRRLFSLLTSFR